MVGLWLAKRWAEYLTLVAITALIPLEIYELVLGVSVFKVITFVINVAIVVYLLLAKRLFGLRGGHRAELERRREFSGWAAIDRATPAVPTGCRPRPTAAPGSAACTSRADDCTESRAPSPDRDGWYRPPPRAVGAVGSALA